MPAPTPGPPFTHAPLVHHHQPAATSTQDPTQPHQPTPYGYPYQTGYPGYPFQPQPQATQQESEKGQVAAPASGNQARVDGHVDDPYEAAQNILKAINFGSLLQLPPEEDGKTADANQSSPTDPPLSVPSTLGIQNTEYSDTNPRAELQAHLALLAAQLAELAQADDEDPVSAPLIASTELQPVVAIHPSPAVVQCPPLMASLLPPAMEQEEEEGSEDDDDMEEVI